MALGGTGLALLAGLLSTLSPCVLPILPIVLGGAASEHRFGPVALAGGLAISFTAIGLFVATVGFSIGIDTSVLRYFAALLLVGIGAMLLVPAFQVQFALAAGPVGNWAEQRFGGFSTGGLGGQFALGLLLGAVWSPCSGPTLGAASVLAAQGRHLTEVALTMMVFGIGAALPLLALGFLSREALLKWRDKLGSAGKGARKALGLFLVATGILILSGLDKSIETMLVQASPLWLTGFTTRF